jgi:hypothetical protein
MRLFKPFVTAGLATLEVLAITLTVSFLCPRPALAKDLSGRLGLGFTNEFSNSTAQRQVPIISIKYGATKDIHLLAGFGFDSLSPSEYTVAGKIFKNIFYETNLNFYAALGAAYEKAAQSGIEMLGLLGCEFFIPGVDSLGFLFETGASANNVTGTFEIKTVGFTFINAGMHFYF